MVSRYNPPSIKGRPQTLSRYGLPRFILPSVDLGGNNVILSIDKLAVWKLQDHCAGLSSCELATCPLVQAREPATGVVVIDISAVSECAEATNNFSGLIEFKTHLGQVAKVAVGIRAYHKGNLWFGEPDFGCRFH